jgi:hypothetical protein
MSGRAAQEDAVPCLVESDLCGHSGTLEWKMPFVNGMPTQRHYVGCDSPVAVGSGQEAVGSGRKSSRPPVADIGPLSAVTGDDWRVASNPSSDRVALALAPVSAPAFPLGADC